MTNSIISSKDFIIQNLKSLNFRFPFENFTYKYSSSEGVHCLTVSSSNLFNSDEFIEVERNLQINFITLFPTEMLLITDAESPVEIVGEEINVCENESIFKAIHQHIAKTFIRTVDFKKPGIRNCYSIKNNYSNISLNDFDELQYWQHLTADSEQIISSPVEFEKNSSSLFEIAA